MKTFRPNLNSNFEEDKHSCMDKLVIEKFDKKSVKEEVNSDKDSVYSNVLLVNNLKSKFLIIKIILLEIFKKDPPNKSFDFHYEIICYCKYDYFTELKGDLSNDYYLKSKFIRNAPKHLISTLISSDKVKEIRNKTLSTVLFNSEDLKSKANKFFKKKLYRSAINCYFEVR